MILKNLIKPCWPDCKFALALVAGPVVWLALYMLGVPVNLLRLDFSNFLLLVLLYPVLEEWVFRGNLQSFIASKLPPGLANSPFSMANLITSLCFAGLHLFSHPPFWAAAVIVPSLAFGWAMERYKTLAAPIILHVFYNAGYFLLFA